VPKEASNKSQIDSPGNRSNNQISHKKPKSFTLKTQTLVGPNQRKKTEREITVTGSNNPSLKRGIP
jgi:hypothetical protein